MCISEENQTYAYGSTYNNIETIEMGNNSIHNLEKSSEKKEITVKENIELNKEIDDSDSGNIEANEKLNSTIEYENEIENNEKVSFEINEKDMTNSNKYTSDNSIKNENLGVEKVKNDKKVSVNNAEIIEVNLGNEKLDSGSKIIQNGLIDISNPDLNYQGQALSVGNERDLLERIVMGEAGGEGFKGQALVAQCIRDTMIYKNIGSVQEVISRLKYSGSLNKTPTEEVKQAVSYIFDQGNNAVQHKIVYFYAPGIVDSRFHESQEFIIEYGGHRFFDEK